MNKKKVFSGFIDDLSPQQQETLDKFRERVRVMGSNDPKYDDIYLLRFLRARKFDLEKTTEMWKNYINWRVEKKVDEVANYEFPELAEAKSYYPHGWFRTDKLGRPMFIERPGKVQLDKLIKTMPHNRLEQHFIHDNEKLMNKIFPACSKAKGELVSNTLYIMDLKGVSAKMLSSKVYDLLKIATKIGQDNYPEILGAMYIVNTPLFFHGAWSLIKGFVDEKTRKKVHILGSGYKKELFQMVDENNLPDFLGGKCTEEDYGANLTKEQGPWIKVSAPSTQAGASPFEDVLQLSTSQRNSTELKDGFDDTDFDGSCNNTFPALAKQYKSIEDLPEGEFQEVAEELPLKQIVKMFHSRASTKYISSCNQWM